MIFRAAVPVVWHRSKAAPLQVLGALPRRLCNRSVRVEVTIGGIDRFREGIAQ